MKRYFLADVDVDNDVDKPSDAVIEDSRSHHEHHAHMTRTILFKTDTRVLPILSMLFLCSFLDRTNVGNAKIIGLAEDLKISNLQYNQGLAVFYATYIARSVTGQHAILLTIHIPCHPVVLPCGRTQSKESLRLGISPHCPEYHNIPKTGS